MQLVGATDGFIRRPFVAANTVVGIVSGLIAATLLALLLVAAPNIGMGELNRLVTWPAMGILALALVAIGATICSTASALATTRHLHQDYEELFN